MFGVVTRGVFPFGLLPFGLLPIGLLPFGLLPLPIGLLPFGLLLFLHRDQSGTGMFSEQISMTYTLTQNITHALSEDEATGQE